MFSNSRLEKDSRFYRFAGAFIFVIQTVFVFAMRAQPVAAFALNNR